MATNNIVSDEIARMQHLFSYRMDEGKKATTSVEYHMQAADGKTYGIIREGSKFYIKCAHPKDTEILAEDYDYIGGISNKKRYEYNSYAMASKQFDLKMMSINESVNKNTEPIKEQYSKQEQSDWCINETKEMRAEINRFNQILTNVDNIKNQGKKKPAGMDLGNPENAGGDPYVKIPVEMNPTPEKAENPAKADDTYTEKPKTTKEINNEKAYKDKGGKKVYTEKAPKINETVDVVELDPEVDAENSKGTGCAKCNAKPYDVKEGDEIRTDDVEGFEMEDEATDSIEDIEIPSELETIVDDENDDEEDEYIIDIEADGDLDEGEGSCEKCGNSAADCTCDECGLNEDIETIYDRIDTFIGDDGMAKVNRQLSKEGENICIGVVKNFDRERMLDIDNFMKRMGYELYNTGEMGSKIMFDYYPIKNEASLDMDECGIGECGLNEWKLDVFGDHPRYGEQAFTLPADEDPKDEFGKLAKGGKYGVSKGKSNPYDKEIDLLVDNIVARILKKKVN